MYKFQDNKIVFPLTIRDSADNNIVGIRSDWRSLKESVNVEYFDNFGILTGQRNNITAIQLHHTKMETLGFDEVDTVSIITPDGYVCYVFEHEDSLNTIYRLTDQLSIYNNNSYIIAGRQYKVIGDSISKMPSQLLDYIQTQQRLNTPELDRKIYDLLMILPDNWFKGTGNVERMIYGLRNTIPNQAKWLYSVKRVLQERWDHYNDQYILLLIMKRMNSAEGRLTFGKIKKEVYDNNIDAYKQWELRYKKYKYRRVAYKKGSNISLELAQALLPKDKLTQTKLSKVHPDIVIKKCKACKSCDKIAHKNCCSKYSAKNRSTRSFIMNANII